MQNNEIGVSNQNSRIEASQGAANREVEAAALKLVGRSKICMLGTISKVGSINIRALLNLKHKGLKQIWFSTNTSSNKVAQIKAQPRVCVYYVDETSFEGLRLSGTMQVCQDSKSQKLLWQEGFEMYYPQGVNDPDYTVLKFIAQEGNYYSSLHNSTFKIE